MYKTKETVLWEQEAQIIISKIKHKKKIIGDVYVGVELFLKYDRDVENNKLINDALQDNGIIENDKQITHLNVKKYRKQDKPRIEIEVIEL